MMIGVTSVEWTWLGSNWPPSLNVMNLNCLDSYSKTLYVLVFMKLLVSEASRE